MNEYTVNGIQCRTAEVTDVESIVGAIDTPDGGVLLVTQDGVVLCNTDGRPFKIFLDDFEPVFIRSFVIVHTTYVYIDDMKTMEGNHA